MHGSSAHISIRLYIICYLPNYRTHSDEICFKIYTKYFQGNLILVLVDSMYSRTSNQGYKLDIWLIEKINWGRF